LGGWERPRPVAKQTLLSGYQQSQYQSGETGTFAEGLEGAEVNLWPMSASANSPKRVAADREINQFRRAYYLCKILDAFGPKCSTVRNCKVQSAKWACGEYQVADVGLLQERN
jgi:hypothetical protein